MSTYQGGRITSVKHLGKGYAGLLTDPAIVADLRARAERIASAAGDGYKAEQSTPHTRARAAVVAANGDPDNLMIRNLDAGR